MQQSASLKWAIWLKNGARCSWGRMKGSQCPLEQSQWQHLQEVWLPASPGVNPWPTAPPTCLNNLPHLLPLSHRKTWRSSAKCSLRLRSLSSRPSLQRAGAAKRPQSTPSSSLGLNRRFLISLKQLLYIIATSQLLVIYVMETKFLNLCDNL